VPRVWTGGSRFVHQSNLVGFLGRIPTRQSPVWQIAVPYS
jgi:hypothetical protein